MDSLVGLLGGGVFVWGVGSVRQLLFTAARLGPTLDLLYYPEKRRSDSIERPEAHMVSRKGPDHRLGCVLLLLKVICLSSEGCFFCGAFVASTLGDYYRPGSRIHYASIRPTQAQDKRRGRPTRRSDVSVGTAGQTTGLGKTG